MDRFRTANWITRIVPALALAAITLSWATPANAEVYRRASLHTNCNMHPAKRGCYEQAFRVNLKAGQTYVIDLTSRQFDTYLEVENYSGRLLRWDDDGGVGLNSRLLFTPTRSGTYRFIATSYRPGATGSFEFRVSP